MTDAKPPLPGEVENPGYEQRDVNVKSFVMVVVAIVVFITIVLVILNEYFITARERQVYQSVLQPESVTLRELRAHEDEVLNAYKGLDPQNGTYQIPISRAMKLIADENFLTKVKTTKTP